ncbi:hypothetical protein NDU88_003647 [Pleurodeles waltl]|uniref:Uncharacterized protein n=1 Tax=Pleurodeles waltl TaxID=8319 RepID=A0AAV7UZ09_PLEWA|nr:hypothetical protein NDU88_003647 [Pleurodeles waltl]
MYNKTPRNLCALPAAGSKSTPGAGAARKQARDRGGTPSGPHGDSSPDLHPPLWAGGGSRRKAKATTPSFPRRAPVSPSVPPIRQTPPQGKTTPAASWRGRNCCGRAHSRPAGLTALWSIRRGPGRGSRPTHGANCPSPVVILPQDLPRGEAPLITRPQPRHATVPRSSPRLVEGGESPYVRYPGEEGGGGARGGAEKNMGLTPSRGGSLPAPRTHLSSRIRSRDQPGAADKMVAAAFSSGPHRNSTSARPPDRTWSRQ